MGFLDNSGDITLDAVLTDTGRMRLARGDGSFKITSFALGDDEINYRLYDKENLAGTAGYDTNILSTPIFEAFTNNIASLNSRLVSYSKNDLFYLPVAQVNNLVQGCEYPIPQIMQEGYIMAVDKDTENYLQTYGLKYKTQTLSNSLPKKIGSGVSVKGLITGFSTTVGSHIRIDQGIDNANVPPAISLPPDLTETQYLIEIDNKLAYVLDPSGQNMAPMAYTDDDGIAAYYLSRGVDNAYFAANRSTQTNDGGQVIQGSRGFSFSFRLQAALEVATSTYLFDTLGTDETSNFTNPSTGKIKSILTSISVTGVTTGCFLNIPILLLKKIS